MKDIVTGNKNWFIKLDKKYNVMICGRPGHYQGTFSCYLRDLFSRYEWFYYTKKADYDKAVEEARSLGFKQVQWC